MDKQQVIDHITIQGQIILNKLIQENCKAKPGKVSSLRSISYPDYKREYREQCQGLIEYVELFHPDIAYSELFARVYNKWHYLNVLPR